MENSNPRPGPSQKPAPQRSNLYGLPRTHVRHEGDPPWGRRPQVSCAYLPLLSLTRIVIDSTARGLDVSTRIAQRISLSLRVPASERL